MAEIIKKGNNHKTAVCKECKCVFSYLPFEIQKRKGYDYIPCPDCFSVNKIEEKENKVEEKEYRFPTEEEKKMINKLYIIFLSYAITFGEYIPKKIKDQFGKDFTNLYDTILLETSKIINKEAE